ncbi:MAG: GntR family transcriptional regulator [Ruminococcaceae bacterium]|nr:GntR family transcriptional regulator [Oscillospiraceae bacterium]
MYVKKTMGDYIYEDLKEGISKLVYAPGEKLSETVLSQKYGVSRAPIRDAFTKLEREGLVRIFPQSGTIVSPISEKKAMDICEIRMLFETYAVKKAAEKITDEHVRELDRQFQHLEATEKGTDEKRQTVFEVDRFMHDLILTLCGNDEITKILDTFKPEIRRIQLSNSLHNLRFIDSEQEMIAIYRALRERNTEDAGKAMETHIGNIQKAVKKYLMDLAIEKGE